MSSLLFQGFLVFVEIRGRKDFQDRMGSTAYVANQVLLVCPEPKDHLVKSLGLKVELRENPDDLDCRAIRGYRETPASQDRKVGSFGTAF